jgi:hypothetical protein
MVVFALGSGHKIRRSIVEDLSLDPFFEPALMLVAAALRPGRCWHRNELDVMTANPLSQAGRCPNHRCCVPAPTAPFIKTGAGDKLTIVPLHYIEPSIDLRSVEAVPFLDDCCGNHLLWRPP